MFEGLEKRVNYFGNISYWKEDEMVYKQCSKCKEIKSAEEFGKSSSSKDKHRSYCLKCSRKEQNNYYQREKDVINEKARQYYHSTIEKQKERGKKYREAHKEERKEYYKKYSEENKEKIRERRARDKHKMRAWRIANKEHIKETSDKYREKNRDIISLRKKEKRENDKRENIENIKQTLELINPILKDLPIYGSIYKITNIKTGHCYIGQTINPLKKRYEGGIVKVWIKGRKQIECQKFLDELIEEDFTYEVIDVGCCKWHLDKLEVHYINKYNSFLNGYNNNIGNYKTDDGIEEFENILKQHGLEYINGELRRIV